MDAPSNTTATMTTTASPPLYPEYAGFIGCGLAVVFFGSNFVPVKKFSTGDGMFFQWILCIAIWGSSAVVNLILDAPTFYPLAMLGGAIWATGNIFVVPIIKTIGLSLGLLCWSGVMLLTGWITARFGMFGIKPETVTHPTLNYAGLACSMASLFIYAFIKPDVSRSQEPDNDRSLLIDHDGLSVNPPPYQAYQAAQKRQAAATGGEDDEHTFIDDLSNRNKRIVGFALAAFSGILYGVNFIPIIYIQNNYHDSPQEGLPYAFAQFTGILLTSSFYFIVYCAYKRNKPKVYPEVILPGIASGVMWAVAQSGWLVANQVLSESVSFPIITTGPGIVASIWGVIVFKEITGKRNLLLLAAAFTVVLTGAILSAFSF